MLLTTEKNDVRRGTHDYVSELGGPVLEGEDLPRQKYDKMGKEIDSQEAGILLIHSQYCRERKYDEGEHQPASATGPYSSVFPFEENVGRHALR
jgi:hypothetical protein